MYGKVAWKEVNAWRGDAIERHCRDALEALKLPDENNRL